MLAVIPIDFFAIRGDGIVVRSGFNYLYGWINVVFLSMRNVVFFGNGLNRISDGDLGWSTLLKKCVSNQDYSGIVPYTLQYENGIFAQLSKKRESEIKKCESKIKETIAKRVSGCNTNEVYEKLVDLCVEDYVTTNYDHAFDKALLKSGYNLCESRSFEKRYSIYRCRIYQKNGGVQKRVWAIHGDCEKPRTLILGHEQYGGQLRKISLLLNKAYMTKNVGWDFSALYKKCSWIDFFFNANVYFIGFGLPYEEMDIWWLLVKRGKIKAQHQEVHLKNRICFYEVVDRDRDDNQYLDKKNLLESMFVAYEHFEKEDKNEYIELYEAIIENIKKSIASSNSI